jgi:hypothetical protein
MKAEKRCFTHLPLLCGAAFSGAGDSQFRVAGVWLALPRHGDSAAVLSRYQAPFPRL